MQKVHTITAQGFFISTKERGGFEGKKESFFILWSENFCRCYRTYIYPSMGIVYLATNIVNKDVAAMELEMI